MKYFLILSIFFSLTLAQYEPWWEYEFPNRVLVYVIGVGNTDGDPQPELVFKQEAPWQKSPYRIFVFDPWLGEVEWESEDFYRIYTEPEKGTRLIDVNGDGVSEILALVEVEAGHQMWILYGQEGIGVREKKYTPLRRMSLKQNSPNPLRTSTKIDYEIPERAKVALKIYDSTGRLVKEIDCGEKEPGRHRVVWRRDDNHGKPVSPGVYFYILEAGGERSEKKAIVIE